MEIVATFQQLQLNWVLFKAFQLENILCLFFLFLEAAVVVY